MARAYQLSSGGSKSRHVCDKGRLNQVSNMQTFDRAWRVAIYLAPGVIARERELDRFVSRPLCR